MNHRDKRLTLVAFAIGIAAVWLFVLPQLAAWGPIHERIRSNEAAGIDPSAMFYTELENFTYRDGMLRRDPQD